MEQILVNIKNALIEYDADRIKKLTIQALGEGKDPVEIMDVLTEALQVVGEGFEKGDLFLPDLAGAATAMEAVKPLIEEEISKSGRTRSSLCRIVLGTVLGDIHNIGKDMVAILLVAAGFEIINLGVNVSAERFVTAGKEHRPKILAMSSLLTTTAPEMGKVIKRLKQEGLRDEIKIMVGGGAITQDFADRIGSDGYGISATGACVLAKKLIA